MDLVGRDFVSLRGFFPPNEIQYLLKWPIQRGTTQSQAAVSVFAFAFAAVVATKVILLKRSM